MKLGAMAALLLMSSATGVSRADIDTAYVQQAATIQALQAQLMELTARLDALESEKSQIITSSRPVVSARGAAQTKALEGIKFKGDFRFRQESFDIDGQADRHRSRLRNRVALVAPINEGVSVGFGLASGSSDPTSANQSLGAVSSSKQINLDLAYVNWNVPNSDISVQAGKFKNPLKRVGGTGLLWDGDVRPEGVTASYKKGSLFATGLGSWVDENKGDADLILLGGQVGSTFKLENNVSVLFGLGYYNITASEGADSLFGVAANENRLDANGGYLYGFQNIEGFAEIGIPIEPGKITLFADYVQNLDADDYDTGYSVGAKVKANKWSFGWEYRDLEADSVLAAFSDSDFLGGGTDGEGHILKTGYALNKKISLSSSLFLNDRNVDFGTEESFKRLMLDISFKH
jgi:hypothetical protein